MQGKSIAVTLVAFFLLTASAGAGICDISCAFEHAQRECSGVTASQITPASDMAMAMDMGASMDMPVGHQRPARDDSSSGGMNLHFTFASACTDKPCLQFVASAALFQTVHHPSASVTGLIPADSAIQSATMPRFAFDTSPPERLPSPGSFIALRI